MKTFLIISGIVIVACIGLSTYSNLSQGKPWLYDYETDLKQKGLEYERLVQKIDEIAKIWYDFGYESAQQGKDKEETWQIIREILKKKRTEMLTPQH